MKLREQFRTFDAGLLRIKQGRSWLEKTLERLERRASSWLANPAISRIQGAFDFLAQRPILAFLIFFALVCSRAIHWISNPQFYIEDGPEFYQPAFNLGISTLSREYASYYHTIPRILSLIAAAFPPRNGPLAMELLAIGVQAAAATYLVSNRLRSQIPSSALRFMLGFLVLGFPYSNELFANIAHSQWYLGLLSVAIVCATPAKRAALRFTDDAALLLNCLTGPFAPLVAGISWSKWRGDKTRKTVAIIASAAAVITVLAILTHPRSGFSSNARFSLFERMISNQVVLGPLFGFGYVSKVFYEPFFNWREFLTALFGVSVLYVGLRKAPPLIKAIALLGAYSCLTSLDSKSSWIALGAPGVGERYFFYLGIVFIACIFIQSFEAHTAITRSFFKVFLVFWAFATLDNWVYKPPFPVFDYPPQIAAYDQLQRGQTLEIKIPIDRKPSNSFWRVHLIKK